ncbi:MAG: C10 family peptidase [Sedimentisphaerales bacterium]|nr:C10 family peptidase [Sedimentisphaerales bacterium]
MSVAALIYACGSVTAHPMASADARRVVQGWLSTSGEALGVRMGKDVVRVDSYAGQDGAVLYHVVSLKPGGFVITSADDEIEPIIAFADDGTCEFSENNPLFVLVTRDMQARMEGVAVSAGSRVFAARAAEGPGGGAKSKWHLLMGQTDVRLYSAAAEVAQFVPNDVRVPPLLASRWNQSTEHGYSCYNYFTPQLQNGKLVFQSGAVDNCPCGCVATALAQLMYYWRYPERSPRQSEYTILVAAGEDRPDYEWPVLLRGGDSEGGPYDWDKMPAIPAQDATDEQRQAIGALCADAGAAVHMSYGSDGSGTTMDSIAPALRDTFHYRNAVFGIDRHDSLVYDLSSELESMANPNLDAGCPVLLCLLSATRGHAIITDGYGYNFSSLYYHLNMGWSGVDDAWYNMPHVSTYTVVGACIYNVFPLAGGEIISGRVADSQGRPVGDVTVVLTEGAAERVTTTNEAGVYAFVAVTSEGRCQVSVSQEGCAFTPAERAVTTGRSMDASPLCGNVWAVDFTLAGPGDESDSGREDDGNTETFEGDRTAGQFDWITDWVISDAAWTSPHHSIKSKPIGHGASSSLAISLDCREGEISFYLKVSSEGNCDFLTFRIDGRLLRSWSGQEDWQYVSFPVTGGRHSFQWQYSKDYSVAKRDDCAWLDDITFPISRP